HSIVLKCGSVSAKDLLINKAEYVALYLYPWRLKCDNCISELDRELAASKFLDLAERGINSIGGKRGHALEYLLCFTPVKESTKRRVCASQILGVDYDTYINSYEKYEHKLLCDLATKMRRFDHEVELESTPI
ncbi:MAG TPA: hypothetical protein VFM05_15290, partial [Candidatus Saccharimonadales bacterium]|nr:hypothetical protein [Candidatus Saccharimonadales bacterium]